MTALCTSRCQDSRQLILLGPKYNDCEKDIYSSWELPWWQLLSHLRVNVCFAIILRLPMETAAEDSLEVLWSCWLASALKRKNLKKPEKDQLTLLLQPCRGQSITGKGIKKGWKWTSTRPRPGRIFYTDIIRVSFKIILSIQNVLVEFKRERGIGLIFWFLHVPNSRHNISGRK